MSILNYEEALRQLLCWTCQIFNVQSSQENLPVQ